MSTAAAWTQNDICWGRFRKLYGRFLVEQGFLSYGLQDKAAVLYPACAQGIFLLAPMVFR